MKNYIKILIGVVVVLVLAAIVLINGENNPIKSYCEDQGNEFKEIEQGEYNIPVAYCVFQDGQMCNALEFYNGQCMNNPIDLI